MPIVRMNEKGEKIPDEVEVFVKESIKKSEEREALRDVRKKQRLRDVSKFVLVGSVASAVLFYFVSPDLGIFAAVLSSSSASILNLWAD